MRLHPTNPREGPNFLAFSLLFFAPLIVLVIRLSRATAQSVMKSMGAQSASVRMFGKSNNKDEGEGKKKKFATNHTKECEKPRELPLP